MGGVRVAAGGATESAHRYTNKEKILMQIMPMVCFSAQHGIVEGETLDWNVYYCLSDAK